RRAVTIDRNDRSRSPKYAWSRAFTHVAALRILAMPPGMAAVRALPPGQIRWPTSAAWRETPHWRHRLARRNSLRELRSDSRRENDGRCALRAPPVLLRFSAAHKARQQRMARPLARAFAKTVLVFVGNRPVFDANATNASRAASGGGPASGPAAPVAGCRAVAWGGGPRRTAGDFGGAEQRSLGVGARSALRTSDLRRCV
ncbi:MAG TPA: hypothetical protein PKD87_10710, partial [Burkholderiaceae bacterium]|nr:hypothetical protein [Burkholderiaceae bacterium]